MYRASTLLCSFLIVASLAAGCSSSKSGTSPQQVSPNALAIIDGIPFTKTDFEREYTRSVGSAEAAASDSMAEYEDFLERYVNYRIKVEEAKEAGLEQDSAIVAELDSYRTQYAKPYLINQKVLDPIIAELYERSLEMVEASHILLRTTPGQSPADTLALYNKLSAIRDSALAGTDFGDLAQRHSEDPSASQDAGLGFRGYLGYFSSGSMVAPFEEWAYKTPVGEVSPVFRTRYGYHILKVTGRKVTPSDVVISHIMITPKSPSASDSAIANVLADSIYQKASRGEDFATLARNFSDDKQSGEKGGQLGRIPYSSRLVPEMKEVAFAIPEVGGIGGPVKTRFGYHIIKLDDVIPQKSFDEAYEELKTKASRSPEAALGETMFADSVIKAMGATLDSLAFFATFENASPDSIISLKDRNELPATQTPVLVFGTKTLSAAELAAEIDWNRYRSVVGKKPRETQSVALRDFLRSEAINHEVDALESKDDHFRATMNEFRNGVLLFRLMEDSVWTAASKDTLALEREYNKDPSRFTYPNRTRLITYFSVNKPPLEAIVADLNNGQAPSVPDSILQSVRIDTTFLAGPSNSIYDRGLELATGRNTGLLAYNSGSIVIKNDGVEMARTKTFDESRAELINIVQTQLEERLVERLRAKFKVMTFPNRLDGVFDSKKNSNGAASTQ